MRTRASSSLTLPDVTPVVILAIRPDVGILAIVPDMSRWVVCVDLGELKCRKPASAGRTREAGCGLVGPHVAIGG
jgi:hypothetical protein